MKTKKLPEFFLSPISLICSNTKLQTKYKLISFVLCKKKLQKLSGQGWEECTCCVKFTDTVIQDSWVSILNPFHYNYQILDLTTSYLKKKKM